MPVRFDHGDIRRLLRHFGFQRMRKDSFIYVGQTFGVNRTVKFDYHSARTQLQVGTAGAIATSLGFNNQQEMKDYIKQNL